MYRELLLFPPFYLVVSLKFRVNSLRFFLQIEDVQVRINFLSD